ncbi:ABC transporter permease [Clostridium celatum]|uniref:ABC transporter, permease protein n=1 Tax=Clostridium celatum DSM 1785 TaxID=545697 RepID=L1Q356_9CLOT|nr:ABC transporter permease [Clostridium celatum]EKY22047.1 ABC transporter, permease protein [Clostridium celatum DSM 1785]MCE9654481.1 ABC transporter permease [Clostridium celatum]MDU3723677.1 ABC transporter permease [Clostridium celatum]MDY3359861.1 ABC transporter permease [Clostridium celatum]
MNRIKYIGSTFLRMLSLLIAVSILSFILVTSSPIDPLTAYVGTESTLSEAAKEEIAEHWGLNDPPVTRFITWGKNVLQGDLGTSITFKQPVKTVILERFKYSIVLMLVAWVFSGVLGFIIGILAGVYKGSIFDKIIKIFCLALQSAPTFWIGLLVLSLFAVKLGWFPIGLAAPMGKLSSDITIWDRIYHLILPALTLSVLSIGKITLFTRQKLIEIMNSDFILFAKARGENTAQLIMRHGIKNIALPAITEQFASFSELFGGIALAETVFSYPGLGTATTAAGLKGDVPLLLGIAIFSAIFVFVGNFIANILYGVLDPRLKEEGYNA